MTKLLNIALMRQDFYHVIGRSSAVLRFCGYAVLQFCGYAVKLLPKVSLR